MVIRLLVAIKGNKRDRLGYLDLKNALEVEDKLAIETKILDRIETPLDIISIAL